LYELVQLFGRQLISVLPPQLQSLVVVQYGRHQTPAADDPGSQYSSALQAEQLDALCDARHALVAVSLVTVPVSSVTHSSSPSHSSVVVRLVVVVRQPGSRTESSKSLAVDMEPSFSRWRGLPADVNDSQHARCSHVG
jgi:hypothetical protein